jgi:hypothetical protein
VVLGRGTHSVIHHTSKYLPIKKYAAIPRLVGCTSKLLDQIPMSAQRSSNLLYDNGFAC